MHVARASCHGVGPSDVVTHLVFENVIDGVDRLGSGQVSLMLVANFEADVVKELS